MKFSTESILSRCDRKKSPLPHLKTWIAENQSRYSETPELFEFQFHYRGAYEAEITFFLCLFMDYWNTDEIVRRMSEDCFHHQYQGEWEHLQELLTNVSTPAEFYDFAETHLSPDEFYGNWLPKANDIVRKFHLGLKYKRNPDKKRKPKRVQRHRGYRDKGSLLSIDAKARKEISDNSPYKDLRGTLRHPLLRFETKKSLQNKGLSDKTHPRKEENSNYDYYRDRGTY